MMLCELNSCSFCLKLRLVPAPQCSSMHVAALAVTPPFARNSSTKVGLMQKMKVALLSSFF